MTSRFAEKVVDDAKKEIKALDANTRTSFWTVQT